VTLELHARLATRNDSHAACLSLHGGTLAINSNTPPSTRTRPRSTTIDFLRCCPSLSRLGGTLGINPNTPSIDHHRLLAMLPVSLCSVVCSASTRTRPRWTTSTTIDVPTCCPSLSARRYARHQLEHAAIDSNTPLIGNLGNHRLPATRLLTHRCRYLSQDAPSSSSCPFAFFFTSSLLSFSPPDRAHWRTWHSRDASLSPPLRSEPVGDPAVAFLPPHPPPPCAPCALPHLSSPFSCFPGPHRTAPIGALERSRYAGLWYR
jgi:hypothetical protein